jgi:NADPH:quinone reductase
VVASIGADVDPAWLGRRVVTGTGGFGGYAEKVAVSVSGLVPVPGGLGMDSATALLADGRTALGLFQLAAPRPGERVLIEAAAGGVGTLLVQLARNAGATVIAAAGGARKCAVARDLGADVTVDYGRAGWEAEIGDIDVAFDGVGGEVGTAALRATRGRFVQYGMSGGRPTDTNDAHVTIIGFRELGGLGERSAELTASALGMATAGTLRPVIGQTFPLVRAADAHAAIESRATIGKTLLVPDAS